MDTLDITPDIRIPVSEIQMSAVRSQGAGGQNVNKVATAIHLRFDLSGSDAIPEKIRLRLLRSSDHRITDNGVIIIKSQAHRSQERNRQAALQRLAELILNATREQKPRKKTKPSKRSRIKRLDAKSRRGALKRTRSRVADD